MTTTIHIGFLLFPNITQLDMTGPAQILSRLPGAQVHLIWKDLAPVRTDAGFTINPTTTFADCPELTVLCVPGGFGIADLLADDATLAFLRRQAGSARYVTSVCNGSMLLAAAGLLHGYRSACHWAWRHYLPLFGAIPDEARVVRDRNRISGAGVTAGIDFGLALAAEIAGEDAARLLQLTYEYDPQPPFDCGSPAKAGAALVRRLLAEQGHRLAAADAQVREAALAFVPTVEEESSC